MTNKESIYPYLAYDLKFKYDEDFVSPQIRTAEPKTIEFLMNNGKPLLRKMDLTKPVKVDGKEIIPIRMLAEIAFPNYNWNNKGFAKNNTKHFYLSKGSFFMKVGTTTRVGSPRQLALFKWLYANKFDVDGLIEKGLAIDVNTLEQNPYE